MSTGPSAAPSLCRVSYAKTSSLHTTADYRLQPTYWCSELVQKRNNKKKDCLAPSAPPFICQPRPPFVTNWARRAGAGWVACGSRGVARPELEGGVGGGGGGGWGPTVCVPKMARPDFPDCKFRFCRRWSLWFRGGGSREGEGGGNTLPKTIIIQSWGSPPGPCGPCGCVTHNSQGSTVSAMRPSQG